MKLMGVDVYIWSEEIPDLPKRIGQLTLDMISNSGTRLYPPPAPEIEVTDWFQCRYISSSEVTNDDIKHLISTLDAHFTWTMIQKLYEINGVTAFSQPY